MCVCVWETSGKTSQMMFQNPKNHLKVEGSSFSSLLHRRERKRKREREEE